MPVRLSAVPTASAMPLPPRPIVWLLLLAVVVSSGAALTLFLWRTQAKVTGTWFWLCLLIFPLLMWFFLLGIRLLVHDARVNNVRTRSHLREIALRLGTTRGQRPITVLASAYESSLGQAYLGEKLINGAVGFQIVTPRDGTDAIQCALLGENVSEKEITVESLTVQIRSILMRIGPKLKALPKKVPVHVRLQISVGIDASVVNQAWRDASQEFSIKFASISSIEATGLLALDQWLDDKDSELKKSAFLILALQLYPVAVDRIAEGTSALLLGLGLRYEPGDAIVSIHRPVAFDESDLPLRCSEALLWGTHKADEIEGLWTSGLKRTTFDRLTAVVDALGMGKGEDPGLTHFDLDAALGQLGAVTGWLTVATAIERCCENTQPQFVVCSENGHDRMLVVSPNVSTINEKP
jgi:hypothetical protein